MLDLNDAVISRVRDATDLVEIVSQVTPLKVSGKSHKGLCPFHREKTPSFHVDRGKGLFYCFGCGEGGDAFKFLMLIERFTFPEAVEHLANRFGIELPRKERTRKDRAKDSLLELIDEAAEAYHQAIRWKPNAADTYLRERGIPEEIRDHYGFGYAPDSWEYLLSRLGRKHTSEELEKAGLVLRRKSGTGFYDRFRNRLMIPIHSESGTLIGFGGRSLDGSEPKYLNSPESEIFNKSTTIYNYHRAKDQIRKLDRAILVEGYFDCIALDSAGVAGVVASMGTSLTSGQASVLRRRASRVVICFDGDDAGKQASLRVAPVLLSAGLAVEIANVGEGDDPDGYLNEHGLESLMEVLGKADDLFDFALDLEVPAGRSLSTNEKKEVLEKLEPLLSAVSDPVAKNDAAQRVADRLGLQFETVWSSIRRRSSRGEESAEALRARPVSTGESKILRALLQGTIEPALLADLEPDWFDNTECRAIAEVVVRLRDNDQALDFSNVATHLKSEVELTRLSELAFEDEEDETDEAALASTLDRMKKRQLDRRANQLQAEIREAERAGDSEKLDRLLREKMELKTLK
ncbi:MAG: DNA primase [Thermoanaerobaculia bacterium]|nr:DNA primase [Thermoanaerobaculia bacterium]